MPLRAGGCASRPPGWRRRAGLSVAALDRLGLRTEKPARGATKGKAVYSGTRGKYVERRSATNQLRPHSSDRADELEHLQLPVGSIHPYKLKPSYRGFVRSPRYANPTPRDGPTRQICRSLRGAAVTLRLCEFTTNSKARAVASNDW